MDEQELSPEAKTSLERQRAELAQLLESLEKLNQSEEWNRLKELVFEKALSSIQRQLLQESLRPEINLPKIYNLQGQRIWAKRYCDITSFYNFHKSLLEEINKKLQ